MTWALLAGGGASRGAVQVAPLEHLLATHGPPSVAVGTSIGAVTVSAPPAVLREAWGTVDGAGTFQGFSWSPWRGLYTLHRLRRMLDRYDACTDLPCPTWVGCYDLSHQRYRLVALHEMADVGDRRDAVVASCAIPIIHQAWTVRGRPLADGGVRSVLGRLPRQVDPSTLDAVCVLACSPVGRRDRRRVRSERDVSTLWGQVEVCYEEWQSSVSASDIAYLRGLPCPVHLWAPETWEQIGAPFDASRARIASRVDLGATLAPRRVVAP